MAEAKFIKRLEEVASGNAQSIGFKASPVAPPPALLLIVALPTADADHVDAAVRGGAEAVIVRVSVQDDSAMEEKRLIEVLAACQNKPCGVVPVGVTAREIERVQLFASLGFDFVIISANDSPDILQVENIGKVIVVDHTFDKEMIKTVNDLDIDAVEFALSRPEGFGKHFSIRDLMYFKYLRNLIRRPIVVRGERSIQPADVWRLAEVGIEGLVIDALVTGSDPTSIKNAAAGYCEAITRLGPAKRRNHQRIVPTLPLVRSATNTPATEPEDPDDE